MTGGVTGVSVTGWLQLANMKSAKVDDRSMFNLFNRFAQLASAVLGLAMSVKL
jgi:hypothetical protein